MNFQKYHGTGNDFVVMEALDGRPAWLDSKAVQRICDRHFGVGADGVLLVERGKAAPFFMRVLNADGSEAEMCGNGIRCVARHIREVMAVPDEPLRIETLAGVKSCRIRTSPSGQVLAVAVSLGPPILERWRIPIAGPGDNIAVSVSALGRHFVGHGVSMGNPHFVIFEGLTNDEAWRYGAMLSTSPMFPMQANISFAEQVGPQHFRLVVYERGCGVTLACGTGAGATAVAAVLTGRAAPDEPITMDLPGGTLRLTIPKDLSDVMLEGPAERVFMGTLCEVLTGRSP